MFRLSRNLVQKTVQNPKKPLNPAKKPQFQRNKPVQTYSEKHMIPIYKTTEKYNKDLAIKRSLGILMIGGFTGVGCRDMMRLSIYSPQEYKEVSENDILSVILRFLVGEKTRTEPLGFTKASDEILVGQLGIDKKNFDTTEGVTWVKKYLLPGLAASIPVLVLALFFAFERRSLRNIIQTVHILPKDPIAKTGPSVNDRVRITFLKSADDYIRKTERRFTIPLADVKMSVAFNKNKEEFWRIVIPQGTGEAMTPFVLPVGLDADYLEFDRKLAMREMNPKVIRSTDAEQSF